MKTYLIIRKEDLKVMGSYKGEEKDETSTNRSYLLAEPICTSIELPEEILEADIPFVTASGSLEEISFAVDSVAKAEKQVADNLIKAEQAVMKLKAICNQLEVSFMAENALLGIKADGLAKKAEVSTKLAGVMSAIKSGDPDLVIYAIKAIPEASYDGKYITEARLLAAANKIRSAMNKAPAVDLDGADL